LQVGRVSGLLGPNPNIQLPRSSTRLQKAYAHVKVLSEVRLDAPYNMGFVGKIHAPGAVVPLEELGARGVVLECVGPEKPARGRQTPVTWILWRWVEGKWQELARTAAIGWEWSLTLKEPAYRALYPKPEFYDVLSRGREVASELMVRIEERLNPEPKDVRTGVYASLYDQVAGRIAGME
jgi:hypothetical protein